MPADRDRDLAREVFGGSDSELSSDEDEELQNQQQQRPPKSSGSRQRSYTSSGGDSEDDYRQEGKSQKPKRPPRSKRRESGGGRPVARKKRKQPVEVDLSELPPEQASKIRLDMRIEEILKSKKGGRPKKRKHEEVLDSFADDEVARLREAMNAAADDDARANTEKLPATSKLRLLPEAMETLRKASLAQSMIDNNLLEGVKRWLEPLPDASLPALNIQREFFNIIRKMEFIDSAVLKESGLGRVVIFYTKCKRVTPDIKRIADALITMWSRPIIKRSASHRDRIVPTADGGGDDGHRGGAEKLPAILARARESEKGRVKKNAVMVPQSELGSYTVAPKINSGVMRGSVSVDVDTERRRKNNERIRSLTRKVTMK